MCICILIWILDQVFYSISCGMYIIQYMDVVKTKGFVEEMCKILTLCDVLKLKTWSKLLIFVEMNALLAFHSQKQWLTILFGYFLHIYRQSYLSTINIIDIDKQCNHYYAGIVTKSNPSKIWIQLSFISNCIKRRVFLIYTKKHIFPQNSQIIFT